MAKIICPHCDTATALRAVLIEDEHALMPDRSSNRESVYEKAVISAIKEAEYPYSVNLGIFQCQACNERFVAKYEQYEDTDWVVVYPIPRKVVADEVPEPIKSEFEEASLCFVVEAYRACTAMCQISLESVWQNQSVSGLKGLLDKGTISSALYDRANEIRLWGNILKHEPITEAVSKEDAEQLLTYLEAILNHIYIEPVRFAELRKKRKALEEGQAAEKAD